MGGAEGALCATKTPVIISIIYSLANPTLQQALVFARYYIHSISALSALMLVMFVAVVAFFKRNRVGRILLALAGFLIICFLVYDYEYPPENFSILYPKEGDKISEIETIYGTKTYDPLCPFVVVYIKDNSGGAKPFRITDFNQIDDVGTWSLQVRAAHVRSTKVTLIVGLSHGAPHQQLQEDLPAFSKLQHVRSINVYVTRQPPSERLD